MKLSNLRIEKKAGQSYLTVDVQCEFTENHELWISIPSQYEGWLSDDVYDAFLLASLYPAMYYNEDIEIQGKVSPRLMFNVRNYIRNAIVAYREEMHMINVRTLGTAIPIQKEKHIATGFSGGVDSFTTIIDRLENEEDESRRIDTFIFHNIGSHGGGKKGARELFHNRYDLLKDFPIEKGLPFVKMDSNLYDFWRDEWEYYARSIADGFACLSIQRGLHYYYLSGEFSYLQHMDMHFDKMTCNIDEMTELYIYNLMSTERMEIILEGAQYTRIEKVKKVAEYEPAYRYLNVCVKWGFEKENAENCSRCLKCARTLKELDVIGKLDRFNRVFDVEWYKRNKKKLWIRYLAGQDDWDPCKKVLLDYAKKSGYPFPPKIEVMLYAIGSKIYDIGRKIYHPIWKLKKKYIAKS